MERITQQTPLNISQFYRLPQLKALLNVSGSSIWAWVKAGKFPKPVKLSSNCTAWSAPVVDAWAAERIASSHEISCFQSTLIHHKSSAK